MARYRLHPAGDEVTRRRAGNEIVRRRLQGLEGRFRLRPGLAAPGDVTVEDAVALVIAEMYAQVEAGWVTRGAIDYTHARNLRSFGKYMTARGATNVNQVCTNLVIEWIFAPTARGPVTRSVQVARRSSARQFFTLCARLGLYDQNPALAIEVGSKYSRHVCPFTDDEIQHLKDTAAYRQGETQTPAVIALMLCGVTSGELAYIHTEHVDFVNGRIRIPESGSQFVRARSVPIRDEWCRKALRARAEALEGTSKPPLVYQGTSDSPGSRTSAVSGRATAALKRARIYREGQTRITSITEWVAFDAYRTTGDLFYVANLLGISSLDNAANLIGHDWVVTDVPPAKPVK